MNEFNRQSSVEAIKQTAESMGIAAEDYYRVNVSHGSDVSTYRMDSYSKRYEINDMGVGINVKKIFNGPQKGVYCSVAFQRN